MKNLVMALILLSFVQNANATFKTESHTYQYGKEALKLQSKSHKHSPTCIHKIAGIQHVHNSTCIHNAQSHKHDKNCGHTVSVPEGSALLLFFFGLLGLLGTARRKV